MKKLRILIPVGLFLVAGLIFVACQKDAPLKGERNVMATTPCINATTGNLYAVDFSGSMTQGNNDPYLYNINVYNTLTQIVYTFSSPNNSSIACVKLNGSQITLTNGVYAEPLPANWYGGQTITKDFWINRNNCDGSGGGVSTTISTTYDLIPPCCTYTGEVFTGQAVSCAQTGREAIYTFGSQNGLGYFKIQGGLTNFTGDDANVFINGIQVDFDAVSTDGWAQGVVGGYTVGQRDPGNSSNRNIRIEGSLGVCADVVVKIVWNSTNTGGYITGDWTVKDVAGVELAPGVPDLYCE
jgi:hypothetical protein